MPSATANIQSTYEVELFFANSHGTPQQAAATQRYAFRQLAGRYNISDGKQADYQ